MRNLRVRRSRSMAEAVVAVMAPRLLKAAGLSSPPYDPRRVAEHLRIEVRETALAPSVDGYIESVHGRLAITLNEAAPPARKRFTLAHELGHAVFMLMWRDKAYALGLEKYRAGVAANGLPPDPVEESLCNRFAADLLMPQRDTQAYWYNRPVTAETLRTCAAAFDVSLVLASTKTLAPSRTSTAVFWHRRPWAMSDWERGAWLSRGLKHLLGRFVESVFQTGTKATAHTLRFDDTYFLVDSARCGRGSLLLVVKRSSPRACAGPEHGARDLLAIQERLPGL